MARLHHTLLTPATIVASTAQANYPADNLRMPALDRPWYATDAAATDITITYPAAGALAAILFYDVNFASATIKDSADGTTFSAGTVVNTAGNKLGRKRAALYLNLTGKKAWRISIGAGTPSDGLSYWRAGAVYGFGASFKLPFSPAKGYDAPLILPQNVQAIANGQEAIADTGPHFQRMNFSFLRKYSDSYDTMLQQLRRGLCALDMELTNTFPEQVWPVRLDAREIGQNYPKANSERLTVPLREIVG